VPVADFERSLVELQGFLRGETVTLEDGAESRIGWIAGPKVPVAVAATGPKVIGVAARHADAIDFTVGAEPDRLRWAIDTARAAARGREISLGAFVDVAVGDDRAVARDLVRGSTSTLARFGAEGAPADGLSDVTREGIEALAAAFDEGRHGQAAAPAAQALTDEFLDRFAVCGPAAEVTERLLELRGLGLDRLVVVPGSLDAEQDAAAAANEAFAADVLPALLAA
jgi:5,10-methylenetetrahydromethanopterin reductase